MIVKVRVGDKYEYLEIPEFLKEDYYNDIERHLTEGEVPISGRVLRWGRSKRVVLHVSLKIN